MKTAVQLGESRMSGHFSDYLPPDTYSCVPLPAQLEVAKTKGNVLRM